MAVNLASGVTGVSPNIPVIPNPSQCDSTGAITAGNAGHVEMDVPPDMGFVNFELVKFTNDGVSKSAVEIFVRVLLPGDATSATIPSTKTTTQGASFKPKPYMQLPKVPGLKLSFVSTVDNHGMILTYSNRATALAVTQP